MSIQNKNRFGWTAAALACLVITLLSFSFPSRVLSQFAGQRTWGGTSSGSANAQTINLANYNGDIGVAVSFKAGFSNTASTTLTINGIGATALRPTAANGMRILVGGEIVAGQLVTVVYDGTNYQIQMPPVEIGRSAMWRGLPPAGWYIEDGSCLSKTDPLYSGLFANIGSIYPGISGCLTGNFGIPDQRGRLYAAIDSQGVNGPAGRITIATSGCNGTTQAGCGLEYAQLFSTNNLPPYTPTGSVSGVIATGTVSAPTISVSGVATGVLNNVSGGGANVTGGGATYFISSLNGAITASAPSFTGTGGTGSFAGTPVGGSGPFTVLNPTLLGISAIKL